MSCILVLRASSLISALLHGYKSDFTEFCGNVQKVRASVPLFQLFQNCVIHGLDRADYEEASSVAKFRQKIFVFSQVLDLDGHVVRSMRKFTVELFYQLHGVADPVEKIRISKRDVLRVGS